MVRRRFWLRLLEEAWRHRSLVWLSGIQRSGKTVLVQSLPGVEYFDCELPRVRRLLEDPEGVVPPQDLVARDKLQSWLDQRCAVAVALDPAHRLLTARPVPAGFALVQVVRQPIIPR